MTNHPHRSRGPYRAILTGANWHTGPATEHATITAARAWAELTGAPATVCTIYDKRGRVVGLHLRDASGDGTRWYRACHDWADHPTGAPT